MCSSLVEFSDPVAEGAHFRFFGLGFIEALLANEPADFFRGAVAPCFELLSLGERGPSGFIQSQDFGDPGFVTGVPRGQSLPDELGPIAQQLHVEHGERIRKQRREGERNFSADSNRPKTRGIRDAIPEGVVS